MAAGGVGGGAAGAGLPAASPGDAPPAAGVDVGAAAASGAGAFGDVGASVSGGGSAAPPPPGAGGPASGGTPPPPGDEEPAAAAPPGDEDDDGDGVVQDLVHAAMNHVPAHGWTAAAIAAGAADVGLPPSAAGLLPGGGAELLTRFLRSVNARVAEQMRDGGPLAAVAGRPVDRVHAAVMGRLALLAPVKGRWGEALALGGRPDAVGGTVRATAEFVDEVWAYAGDVSTDFSWYTKRAGLATLYHTIELYWLTDTSADASATSAFARRTLGSAASADAALSGVGAQLGAAARAVAATAEGVLGGSARRGF